MENFSLPAVKSTVADISWPAIPTPAAATRLAIQDQLDKSQWLSSEKLAELQFRQLHILMQYAHNKIPFYRQRLDAAGFKPDKPITPEWFAGLPLLRRSEIQETGEKMLSPILPEGHGKIHKKQTSGSTGKPITVYGTDVSKFFWTAITLRDHLWHRRDFSGKLASIRTTVQDGEAKSWGPATDLTFHTGPAAMFNIKNDIKKQLQWLVSQNPDYLISHPSNLLALATDSISAKISIPNLKEIRTFGETVTLELREACRKAWNVPVKDMYSSEEAGYIALQCPEHEHYHIQSEFIRVEVLRDDDTPCGPGEAGRVVLTPLHNFAMPLIRYEILDYAEVGPPCPCGRGLPVLTRIMGRQRNLVTLPDGSRHWPSFAAAQWSHIAPIRQIQLVQKKPDHIEARLVTAASVTVEQERQLTAAFQKSLGYPFQISFTYLDHIERKANAKYEDFISEI